MKVSTKGLMVGLKFGQTLPLGTWNFSPQLNAFPSIHMYALEFGALPLIDSFEGKISLEWHYFCDICKKLERLGVI